MDIGARGALYYIYAGRPPARLPVARRRVMSLPITGRPTTKQKQNLN